MLYRFSDFIVDSAGRQLLRRGEELHLTPKAFDLLQLLLENHGRAVSKTELQQRMWPSTFVEETNLASLVAEIRRALADSATRPRYVRTVYGFGYRFVGTVDVDAERAAAARPAKLWLSVQGRHIQLMEGVNVIGRAPDAAIQVDSQSISRHHARVTVADGEATLEDNGSKNGTFLNGSRIFCAVPLADGDEMGLGAVVVTFRATPDENHTETIPQAGS